MIATVHRLPALLLITAQYIGGTELENAAKKEPDIIQTLHLKQ